MHTICTPDQRESFAYLQRLASTLFATDMDLGSKLQRLFAEETAEFGLDYAFLSRIDRDAGVQQFEVVHDPDGHIEPVQTMPLERTYCRKTIGTADGAMAVSDAREEGWADDPAFDEWGFGTYLGTTVTVDADVYGTLGYVNSEPRAEAIVPEEEALVGMQGQFVSYKLSQWTEEPPHESVETVGERPDVIDAEIDTMMDALGSRERRVVLVSLLAAGSDDRMAFVEERLDGDHVRTSLYHTHLPRLEEAGYVTYDHDAGTIEMGSNFPQVEPLLRLLWEYVDAGGE
jgi:hypothetical protein